MRKIFLALIVAVPLLIAAFSPDAGFQWLISKSSSGNVANDIPTTVLAALAFRSAGAEIQAQQSLAWVKSRQDSSGCFPAGACKVKDTAFAHWLFYSFNEDTAKTSAWLKSAVSPALTNGDWWLQVATSSTGTCKISYQKDGQAKEQAIQVEQGKFPACSTPGMETFLDLNRCLETNLVSSNPFLQLDVDCSSLGSTIISAVFQSGNTYYLLDEASTSRATININNGCFGKTAKSSCDLETSLYANVILQETGSSLSVTPWLESNYNKQRVLDASLLAAATQKDSHIADLKALQKADGSFQTVYDTAFAAYALRKAGNIEERAKAVDWLKTQQKADGSWSSKELDTAAVLYSAFSDTSLSGIPSCSNGIRDGDEAAVDCGGSCGPCTSTGGSEALCGDYICDISENEINCPQDCQSQASCNSDGICDRFLGESSLTCISDCPEEEAQLEEPIAFCGDNQVNGAAEACDGADDAACPGLCNLDCTCEEESSSGWRWILILLVILLIGIAVYYFFFMKKKPSSRPSSSQTITFSSSPKSPQQPQVQLRDVKAAKSRWEEDLDKSLKEARKLFEKK